MNYMTNKIVAIQGDNLKKLNPKTDTSLFLADSAQKLGYKIFYYEPHDLSVIKNKVTAKGYFVEINYNSKKLIHAYGPHKKVITMPINQAIDLIEKTANLGVKKISKIINEIKL